MNIKTVGIALIFPVAGLLIGLFMKKFVLRKIISFTKKTDWAWDDVAVGSTKGLIIPFFVLLGCYWMIHWLTFDPVIAWRIQKGVMVLCAVIAIVYCARFAKGVLSGAVGVAGKAVPSVSILGHVVSVLVYGLGLLMILQSLGVSITPVLTALGVGGLAVALALQPTLSNFFAGISIILSKQIHVGDYMRLGEGTIEGHVTDITWRNTTIKTLANNLVVVPNSILAGSMFTNYTKPEQEVAVKVDVSVAYNSDLEKVEKIAHATAKKVLADCEAGVTAFEPVIRFHTFGQSSVDFTVVLRARDVTDQLTIKHQMIKDLLVNFRKEGVEIPYPIRTVNIVNR
ncbi:MAG: mechanosensitive ion channel family protein [Fibrobacteres bacterium]|nr:mechanosensitive ion channel family protein [Fibrobacterota bacterium]